MKKIGCVLFSHDCSEYFLRSYLYQRYWKYGEQEPPTEDYVLPESDNRTLMQFMQDEFGATIHECPNGKILEWDGKRRYVLFTKDGGIVGTPAGNFRSYSENEPYSSQEVYRLTAHYNY